MNEQKMAIESLAMDLKRVALGLHRGSNKVADRFKEEALAREREIETHGIHDAYLTRIVTGARNTLLSTDERVAEDALMYSTLFQNYAQKRM